PRAGVLAAARCAIRRLLELELVDELLEALAILGEVDRVRRRADDRHARVLESAGELERRLTAVGHDHALRLLLVDDLEHVLERHRLEIEAIRRVVVRRYGL